MPPLSTTRALRFQARRKRITESENTNMATTQLQEGQLIIPNSRLGYPKLWKAEAVKGDPNAKARFGCAIYLPKSDTVTRKKLEGEIERLTKEKFKGVKVKTKDLFIKDGDSEDGDENTKGYWIISANRAESQGRPQVVDRARKPIDSADAQMLYAGCVCNFLISIYVPKGWSKICASLEVVGFVKDGDPFGAARVDAAAVMPELDDEEDDDTV